MLFHIFPNDLFLFIKKVSLHSYAEDNTLSTFSTKIDSVIKILKKKKKIEIDWLHTNEMIANPQMFQTIPISVIKNAIPEDQTYTSMR